MISFILPYSTVHSRARGLFLPKKNRSCSDLRLMSSIKVLFCEEPHDKLGKCVCIVTYVNLVPTRTQTYNL